VFITPPRPLKITKRHVIVRAKRLQCGVDLCVMLSRFQPLVRGSVEDAPSPHKRFIKEDQFAAMEKMQCAKAL